MVAALAAGCSLFKVTIDTPESRRKAEEARQAEAAAAQQKAAAQAKEAEQQAAAAQQARDQATVAELEALRAELTRGPDGGKAIAFADKVAAAKDSPAARDGRLNMDSLHPEALGYLERAIDAAPSHDLFLALDVAAGGADGDPVVRRACPRVRPVVPGGGAGRVHGDLPVALRRRREAAQVADGEGRPRGDAQGPGRAGEGRRGGRGCRGEGRRGGAEGRGQRRGACDRRGVRGRALRVQ
ncbi:MAG: hypothetical protein IPO88_19595 [Nannocystis sp.]|uniref:hypothetical protein n=1 Tax=Nannocystis sp. TaxID=1962667 RepID=UPI002422EB12|nr:hypothetical protein [Nannocystis sp.]MBK9755673.1 hypothetical protein [Nannocystis sp.]